MELGGLIDGLFEIAAAINNLAGAFDRLGLNGATTGKGAVEVLSMEVKGLAEAIQGGLDSIGEQLPAGPSCT